ncbi:acyltransferase [Marinomonas shanghaiensis]|uniref:acyltransferase n=1 Tax=Marinomonas shanghaiensis TaxID=2202418 RepID=UPI000DBA1DE4|nr:acyltransferase [Marinomonas shanghaiensis]
MKELLKGILFYFINHILNKVPSRKVRMFFYCFLSGNKISRKAVIGLGVKILDIRGIHIGEYSNINFDSILDGRGDGVYIGSNVDIAPQVNIWSLEHNPKSSGHEARSGKVIVEDGCWLANRVIVLPNTFIGKNVVVAAGSIVHGRFEAGKVLKVEKAKVTGVSFSGERKKLKSIRIFR